MHNKGFESIMLCKTEWIFQRYPITCYLEKLRERSSIPPHTLNMNRERHASTTWLTQFYMYPQAYAEQQKLTQYVQ